MKLLFVYPNLPLMMSPSLAIGIFTAIAKEEDYEVDIFETTLYSNAFENRHIKMTKIGASRENNKEDINEMFLLKSPEQLTTDLEKKIQEFSPDIILVSILEDTWDIAKELLKIIKKNNILCICGGLLPTVSPELVLENENVDILSIYEGEITIRQILKKLKNNESIYDCKGLIYKKEGKIINTGINELCDINDIIPDYGCFDKHRWNRPMGGLFFKRAISMETMRGCPYSCTYCNSPGTRNFAKKNKLGNFLRQKSLSNIEKELNYYIENLNPDLIMFQDDSFLAKNEQYILDFCKMWSKYKIPFWFNTRIENCKPNILSALKEAGCFRMTFGIESGDENFRKNILNRKVTNKKYLEHINYINESNIPYSLNVILGLPFETLENVLNTADFIYNCKGYDGLTISMYQPYRGTVLRDVSISESFLDENFINTSLYGYLDDWHLQMPTPYLQKFDVLFLVKVFSLLAYFGREKFDEILKLRNDEEKYNKILEKYKKLFFYDIQQGGNDRIKAYCAKHDSSSTYNFIPF